MEFLKTDSMNFKAWTTKKRLNIGNNGAKKILEIAPNKCRKCAEINFGISKEKIPS